MPMSLPEHANSLMCRKQDLFILILLVIELSQAEYMTKYIPSGNSEPTYYISII